ncbi:MULTISPECIES: DNA repair protein RecO [unclassified Prochlorococcus]|uniref:DNA repair protein RecO n=1 Tax=unclassified Prochlorococcus TaxID=2627481 RepID=UPI000533AFC9|nr:MULTISPECIES: DNA repair protein RecO C-terminal domain-containing protein [unclassified Prochlorococcus]KGG29527.1 DNA recombination and repair protein RecO [Prochlorococcus sp. MIT 0701]KGG35746.1 DNA recombination and repair protein RecO [Prochlorococcus sp. MIT 0703]
MSGERRLNGLSLKVGPLGEHDRLLTLLSDQEGVTRLAVPGARRPRSSLAAAVPLSLLELQVGGRRGLSRVRQLKVLRSFNSVGKQLETLAAAQALAELSLMLVGGNDPLPGLLNTLLMHLERLEALSQAHPAQPNTTLACSVQACVHLLALGGYGLPVQECCRNGTALEPPLGQWEWRCSLMPEEGFAIGALPGAAIQLNPSELALLQRLLRPALPMRRDGELMGPIEVWLRLLAVVECWIRTHLPHHMRALGMLREAIISSDDGRS